MPNEDFSIKTGIEVDDSKVSQLKSIADELEKTAKALQKINNVKFNGDIFSGLTNAGKNIQNVTKEIDKLQKSANGAGKPLTNIGKGAESIVSGNSKQFTLLDLTSIDVIKSSMSEIADSAQNLRETLGSEVTSGLMTQIDAMLAKKDELQNLANILKSNKEDLGKAAKATGNKKNAVSEEYYSKNYQKMYESGISELKKKYPDSDIVGPQIRQLDDGMVKFSASIRSANGEWQKLSATMTKDGNLLYQNPKGMTQTASASAEKAYQNIKAGKLDPKDFLNFDQTEAYAQKLNQIFEEAYGKTDKYTAKVEADGQAVISKALPSGEEVTVMQARIDDVKQIMSEYEQVAGDAVKVKEFVEKNVSSISAKVSSVSKKSANSTSSSTSIKTPKYVTDQSYVGDYKTLADNEAFARTLDTFRHNTTEANAAIEERNKIMARVNAKTPQNTAETNAKQRFDDIDKTITDNFSKYGDRIQSAYNAFDKIKADKSGIAGIGDVFKSSEEQINKWATAVAKGKIGISEFEKKVSGLSGSVSSIGKIIDPASITDAKGELESYLRELTNVQDITFSGFTEKNGIVSLKGTFKDSAGEAQTLSVQLNTLNGQIKNLGTSVKPVESGLSKFFSGWKEKMVNLAQYLTSFQAMNQVWNTFKQGLEIVKEFDTALTEMRKVSDEPISKLKEFQKESFDMAKSVGTTALQIQNSTADFMRLGQSMEEAKQSSVNANILKNVSEFDNVDDATSALISMQAAYKDLTQTELIDKLDNIGNRYAVATDELATGLQKSGATLSLMGNNIDESVALLTAANSQIQNIDTVAAGEKVISLRIAGTEEAKKELEELGEDTSDYVVATKAKKQQIIKDYTAVASNGGKGVDILDANGNYKNMFEIMNEIGSIYAELQAEDKKYGENRSMALIEELAGTNYNFSRIMQKCIIRTYLIAGKALCFAPQ